LKGGRIKEGEFFSKREELKKKVFILKKEKMELLQPKKKEQDIKGRCYQ